MAKNALGKRIYKKYRWLNMWKLVECYIYPEESLDKVYYFTASPPWSSSKKRKHRDLVKAQKKYGVHVIHGRFRPVTRKCLGSCQEEYKTYEEKRTDVNIAVKLVELTATHPFDKAILISADSDLTPAVEAAKHLNPQLKITVVTPIKLRGKALHNVADYKRNMKPSDLKRSVLPRVITLEKDQTITCPDGWL